MNHFVKTSCSTADIFPFTKNEKRRHDDTPTVVKAACHRAAGSQASFQHCRCYSSKAACGVQIQDQNKPKYWRAELQTATTLKQINTTCKSHKGKEISEKRRNTGYPRRSVKPKGRAGDDERKWARQQPKLSASVFYPATVPVRRWY